MAKNILFVDIDGTLVGVKDGKAYIPQSAIDAIRQTRKNGNLVYLCTGRSLAEIYDNILEIGFDGIIGAAGGYIQHEGKAIFHKTLSKENLSVIEPFLVENDYCYYLEANSGLYATQSFLDFLKYDFYHGNVSPDNAFYYAMQDINTCSREDVNKISFISKTSPFEVMSDRFQDDFYLVRASWGKDIATAGEISNKGINKATAIHFLLEYLDCKDATTYAFGDSMNDLEMFECCNYAIAMGDSRHGVADHADFVTKDLLDDGLAYAIEHYHLI